MVEHEVERYEDKAPEQQLAFHDPYAFEVGFDGLFLVEEEPCGDGGVGWDIYAAGFVWSYRVGMRPMDHLDCY